VQAKLNTQAARLLKDCGGVTLTQWRILALIAAIGRCTAAQLSRHSDMDKGLISRNLKALGAGALVRIIPDTEDHRLQHLELTEEGRALFDRILPRMQARQKALRARLSDEETRHFLAALDKLESAAEDTSLG
jgi:DNA-binding MarR family transcriptional regulator